MPFRVFTMLLGILLFSQASYAIPIPLQKPTRSQSKIVPEAKFCKASLELAGKQQWEAAFQKVNRKACPTTYKLISWLQLREGNADINFSTYAEFIMQNPHWPWIGKLRNQAENHITDNTKPADLIGFFKQYPPLTLDGAWAYIKALMQTNRDEQAITIIRQTWIQKNFTDKDQQLFLKGYARYLGPKEHKGRINLLLANESVDQAGRMLNFLSKTDQATAKVRIAFLSKDKQAEEQANYHSYNNRFSSLRM